MRRKPVGPPSSSRSFSNISIARNANCTVTALEYEQRTLAAEWPVLTAASVRRSSSATEPTPALARKWPQLAPMIPPPMITASAVRCMRFARPCA